MTIQPLLTCAFGIALAALFELVYSYVDKRWCTPAPKEFWAGTFWLLVVMVLVQSRMMPTDPPGISPWVPFIAVGVIHLLVALNGGDFSRSPWERPPDPPESKPPTPSGDSTDQTPDSLKKPNQSA